MSCSVRPEDLILAMLHISLHLLVLLRNYRQNLYTSPSFTYIIMNFQNKCESVIFNLYVKYEKSVLLANERSIFDIPVILKKGATIYHEVTLYR